MISDRLKQLQTADPQQAQRLELEVKHLQQQLKEHRRTFERMDESQGVGYVAMAGKNVVEDKDFDSFDRDILKTTHQIGKDVLELSQAKDSLKGIEKQRDEGKGTTHERPIKITPGKDNLGAILDIRKAVLGKEGRKQREAGKGKEEYFDVSGTTIKEGHGYKVIGDRAD